MLAAVAATVVAGCGGGSATSEEAPVRSAESADGLIVGYEAGNHLHRYGARVYADGRYEQFSTSQPAETPRWEAFEPFGESRRPRSRKRSTRPWRPGFPTGSRPATRRRPTRRPAT